MRGQMRAALAFLPQLLSSSAPQLFISPASQGPPSSSFLKSTAFHSLGHGSSHKPSVPRLLGVADPLVRPLAHQSSSSRGFQLSLASRRGDIIQSDGKNEKSVVLLSGGVESTVLLHLQNPSREVVPLFVDYAQRGAAMERRASASVCNQLGLEMVELDASGIGWGFRSLQKQRLHVPVPHRNLVILSLALSLASQEGARSVVLALQADDADWYPSASDSFVTAFSGMAKTLEPDVSIETPFRQLNKVQVIKRGLDLGVDFSVSYSCMRGRELHCGTCKQCVDRIRAFTDAGHPEPPGFYERGQ